MNSPTPESDAPTAEGQRIGQSQAPAPSSGWINRRRFLQGVVGSTAVAGGLYGWATRIEPHWVHVDHHPLAIRSLPDGLQGKTLVQISDLHIGSTDEAYLMATMAKVNALRPDIVVITGDIIDHFRPDATDRVTRVLSTLNHGAIATFSCLGNHDYGHRWSQVDVAENVTAAMRELGMPVLRNEHVDVMGLSFLGLEEYWSPRFSSGAAARATQATADGICLCHNPDVCDRPVWSGFRGIILSGHTHGGQCKPPLMQPPRLPVKNKTYVNGFYDLGDDRKLYVNRGLGYGYRARFNCRPEITHFTLTKAADASV
jgi:uncharacterized protein